MSQEMEKHAFGINVLASLLIVTSLLWIISPIGRFSNYSNTFEYLPKGMILTRYLLSMTGRATGIICGIGILLRREIFRRLAIFLCATTIVFIKWKHPFYLFKEAATGVLGPYADYAHIDPARVALIAWLTAWFIDIAFAAVVIFYLSRPNIRARFV